MGHFKEIIGHSPSLESIIRNAKMVAATDVTVLIKGETPRKEYSTYEIKPSIKGGF